MEKRLSLDMANLYALAKPFLFQLDAENAHDLTLRSLKLAEKSGLLALLSKPVQCQTKQVMGLSFPNPVGLAAGLDKNGAVIDGLAALGCVRFGLGVGSGVDRRRRR